MKIKCIFQVTWYGGISMGYAIVGYFDSVSDRKIKTLWEGLADIGVDDYLINSDNNPLNGVLGK